MVPSRDPSAITAALSRNVRAVRLGERLTLDAMAARAGISKGMLVQVEQGRTNPSLATLCRLANALGVSLPQLLDVGPATAVQVVRRDDNVVLWEGERGGEGRMLAASEEPWWLELWEFRLAPGDAHKADPQPPGTVEMVYVLAGHLTMRVEDESVQAPAGDTVMFRPDRDHEYRNAGTEWVHMMIANVEPVQA
ncbi:MAG: cupin domain-containing protein [Gemmatimonadales bacterium]|nr:cupin domain-containing protein [Gemmatimonadales bacterium]